MKATLDVLHGFPASIRNAFVIEELDPTLSSWNLVNLSSIDSSSP
jgi:hypothetical protein